jgi:hypothetical protein
MPVEILLAIGLLVAAATPLVRLLRRGAARATGWLAVLGAAAIFGLVATARWLPSVAAVAPANRPVEVQRDGYVSSGACRACHPRNHSTWRHTWHRTMTQIANARTALGRFDGAPIEIGGARYRMWREGEKLFGAFAAGRPGEGPGERVVPLVLSTGSHHMQVYWYPTGSGRLLDQFPLVWLREAARWVPRNAAFVRPPTGEAPDERGRWNATCIKCLATRGRPRLIELGPLTIRRGVRTEAAELGIACEACHGPGARHVRANRDPLRRYRLHLAQAPDPTIVNPARLSPARSAQVCGQCHSVFAPRDDAQRVRTLAEGFDFVPGDDLEASRHIVRHGPGARRATGEVGEAERALIPMSFWPDGMVRVSGREYNALTDSPCFVQGNEARGIMTCLSCHRLHQARDDARSRATWADDLLAPGMRGNDACLGCHAALGGEAALERHTRHPAGSSGSLCYNCHMPPTTFGLLKAMRSHTIDSPSAATAASSGRPLACNLCHLDRSLRWGAQVLSDWYGHDVPPLTEDQASLPASVVALLSGDAAQRALAAWAMGWRPAIEASGDMPRAALLGALLDDPYDAVRYVAARSIARQPDAGELEYDFLAPPAERVEAARRLRGRDRLAPDHPSLLGARLAELAARRDDRPVLLAE